MNTVHHLSFAIVLYSFQIGLHTNWNGETFDNIFKAFVNPIIIMETYKGILSYN